MPLDDLTDQAGRDARRRLRRGRFRSRWRDMLLAKSQALLGMALAAVVARHARHRLDN